MRTERRICLQAGAAVDLDTGVVVAAPIHPADEGDTTTLSPTLRRRAQPRRGSWRRARRPCVVVADKAIIRANNCRLCRRVWRRASPNPTVQATCVGMRRGARKAVYANRVRLKSDIGRETMPAREMSSSPSPMSSSRACSSMAARTVEPPQALPDPCRRFNLALDARPLLNPTASLIRPHFLLHHRAASLSHLNTPHLTSQPTTALRTSWASQTAARPPLAQEA